MVQNPYDLLGVSRAASKGDIIKAVAAAMKEKRHPVRLIAEAQKSLLEPERRLIADFTRPILGEVHRPKRQDYAALDEPAPELVLLTTYDALESLLKATERLQHLEQDPTHA